MAKPRVTKAERRELNEELGFDTQDPAAVKWEAWKMVNEIERFLADECANDPA